MVQEVLEDQVVREVQQEQQAQAVQEEQVALEVPADPEVLLVLEVQEALEVEAVVAAEPWAILLYQAKACHILTILEVAAVAAVLELQVPLAVQEALAEVLPVVLALLVLQLLRAQLLEERAVLAEEVQLLLLVPEVLEVI